MHALVEQFARVRDSDPRRRLIHLPATGRTLTAADIEDLSRRFLLILTGLGIQPGDVVLSVSGNRAGAIPVLLACWTMGASVLPVDAGTPIAEVLDLADRFQAAAVVVGSKLASELDVHSLDEELAVVSRSGQPSLSQPSRRDVAILKLTSGSTGVPKGVMATDAQLVVDGGHIVSAMGIAPDDTQLGAIPLSHAYGLGNLVLPLLLQGTAIALREAFAPLQLAADARHYGARAFHGVPFMYQHFLANPPTDGWPPTLTLLVSAGAPLDLETLRSFHDRFGVKIHSFYGASESGGITYDDRDDLDVATVGRAMPGVVVTLRPDPGVPPEYGRVHVSSKAVSAGYFERVGEGGDLSSDGFLTGDYGYFLDDDRLVLAGRVSSFINVAGQKVQPAEVERVLKSIDGVTGACVLAATDVARGEQVAAVIAGPASLTLSDVRRHCATRLAPHKIPRIVVVVDRLPVTARGKADHRALGALVQARVQAS